MWPSSRIAILPERPPWSGDAERLAYLHPVFRYLVVRSCGQCPTTENIWRIVARLYEVWSQFGNARPGGPAAAAARLPPARRGRDPARPASHGSVGTGPRVYGLIHADLGVEANLLSWHGGPGRSPVGLEQKDCANSGSDMLILVVWQFLAVFGTPWQFAYGTFELVVSCHLQRLSTDISERMTNHERSAAL